MGPSPYTLSSSYLIGFIVYVSEPLISRLYQCILLKEGKFRDNDTSVQITLI